MDHLTSKLRLAMPTNALNLAIGGTTTLSDGTPVRRFMRYLLQIGQKYVNKRWAKPLDVTEERAAHWLSVWNEMKTDGVAVKITEDHKNFKAAANTMGDQVDLIRQGDWLCSIHDIRGEKNIQTAEASKDMSVEIYPVSDMYGNGKVYKDAILAVTYTPIPVVHSQPIAASMADDFETLYLSMGDPTMMDSGLMCSIASLTGVKPEEVNEANAKQHVDKHIAECKSMKMSLDSANSKLAEAEAKVLKLSITPDAPSKREAALMNKLASSKFDRLVETGAATKATADGFKELLVGEVDKPSSMLLSLYAGDEVDDVIEKVCKLITDNKPVDGSEKTRGQHLSLTRPTPDDDGQKKSAGYAWGAIFPQANTPAKQA